MALLEHVILLLICMMGSSSCRKKSMQIYAKIYSGVGDLCDYYIICNIKYSE